ncbi:MAG TPA: biotin--[acetyl-CoA-carboxylase] ligase [Stellaceae bacterium]|nr:biotin--[acetyl-CoA-carboxylase] ligase [Stellaceae bacterium]
MALSELPAFFSLRHVADIDSTNDEAKRQAAAGASQGLTVWADRQTAGRGRQGRVWQSPPGNLYCSILLRPECAAAEAAQLSFAAALAVCDALAPWQPRCKWPNDVLIGDKKIAGILLESEAAGAHVAWLVIGIGINLAHHPAETETPATSLAALGTTMAPGDMVPALCGHFLRWHELWRRQGLAPLRRGWLDRAYGLGGEIRVRYAHTETRGRFVDLDASGALVLENGEGTHNISAGMVFPEDI